MSSENQNQNGSEEEKALDIILKEAQRRKLKSEWEKKLVRNPEKIIDVKKEKGNKLLVKLMGMAAIFLLVTVCVYQFSSDNLDLQETVYAMAIDTKVYTSTDLTSRGLTEVEDIKLKELYQDIQDAIIKGDLTLALTSFEKLEERRNLTIEEQFNYAVTLIKSSKGDEIKAKKMLDEVLKEKTPMHQEAMWFNAILHIQLKDNVQAEKMLKEVIYSGYKNNEAKKLLELIKTSK